MGPRTYITVKWHGNGLTMIVFFNQLGCHRFIGDDLTGFFDKRMTSIPQQKRKRASALRRWKCREDWNVRKERKHVPIKKCILDF